MINEETGEFIMEKMVHSQFLPYACVGVFCAGLVYLLLAALIRTFGAQKVMRFFPPIVTGPIIISIGITLASSAIDNCMKSWPIALVAIAVVIICICAIKDLINVYGHRNKFSPNKKFSFISSLIFCGIFFIYFTFNLIVFCVNYNKFLTFLTANAPGFVINMTNGADIIMVKNIIICVLFIVASAVVFFAFMLNREKEQKQQIKQAFNFNFYSDEYEQKESNEIKPVEVEPERQEEQQEVEKAKPKKQAQDLVTRIMQLNELKDTGQISDVEYTKLRQKAIKRYKA